MNPFPAAFEPNLGGFARCRDELAGLSKGWRSPRPGTDCCSAGRDPVTCHHCRRSGGAVGPPGWMGAREHQGRRYIPYSKDLGVKSYTDSIRIISFMASLGLTHPDGPTPRFSLCGLEKVNDGNLQEARRAAQARKTRPQR